LVEPTEPVLAALSVGDAVASARFPYHRWWEWEATAADELAVDGALARAGLATFRSREIGTLSAGERQRVWIALAIAATRLRRAAGRTDVALGSAVPRSRRCNSSASSPPPARWSSACCTNWKKRRPSPIGGGIGRWRRRRRRPARGRHHDSDDRTRLRVTLSVDTAPKAWRFTAT